MHSILPGVYKERGDIFTQSLVPRTRVYDEKLVHINRDEFRRWDPARSKLAAAILKGMKEMPIKEGSIVLYLGASTGTTVSHVSDIVGMRGTIYAVEFAGRVMNSLLQLAEKRRNISPIFADARKPETYTWVEECDVVYCDIAQPDQTEIAIRNCAEFLKPSGHLLLVIKSQSIDVTMDPKEVYIQERERLEVAGFDVLELIDIEPFEEKHAMIIARKK